MHYRGIFVDMKSNIDEEGGRTQTNARVVSAIDAAGRGDPSPAFVVSDVSRDDSWVSVAEADAVELNAHR